MCQTWSQFNFEGTLTFCLCLISLPIAVHIYYKWFGIWKPAIKLFKSSLPLCSGAWEWKRTSGVLQPRPALLWAHPSRRLFPQHLHLHTNFPWWPGFWLPPAAPAFPQRWTLRWIRTQRAGCRQQCQDGGTLEASVVGFCQMWWVIYAALQSGVMG